MSLAVSRARLMASRSAASRLSVMLFLMSIGTDGDVQSYKELIKKADARFDDRLAQLKQQLE